MPEDQKIKGHLENETTEYLEHPANSGNSYLILNGPEGAFSDEELLIVKGKQSKAVKLSIIVCEQRMLV